MSTPEESYAERLSSGALKADAAQAEAVSRLQALWRRLDDYARGRSRGLLGFVRKTPPPRGLYIWGPVGRGKSMLMDLFFEAATIAAKRRVHFHAFMQETHAAIRDLRAAEPGDPVPKVARRIAREAQLLCFDEFQVTDIADAMLLGRLFDSLFDAHVIVVATSNRPPDDLYRDGINRQLFVPFIDMLNEKLDVFRLAGPVDYRLDRVKGLPVYLTPADDAAKAVLDDAWERLTDGAAGDPLAIPVLGRTVVVPRFAHGVGRATFEQLCAQPLGPADLLAVAERCSTVILDGIPVLAPSRRDEARRFVILIDALYDSKRRFMCSAEAPSNALCPAGDSAFEFERTASRLVEMQSSRYLDALS